MAIRVHSTGQTFISFYTYVNSLYWKDLRDAFLKHTNFKGKCPVCKQKKKFIDVHHKHYATLGRESFDDLEVMCKACHAKLHHKALGDKATTFSILNDNEMYSRDTVDQTLERLAA